MPTNRPLTLVQEVLSIHSPNSGRQIWNQNDFTLARQISAIARNVQEGPYNAAGDAVQNDREAIQKAIDDCASTGGGWVFLPPGQYLLDQAVVLRSGVNLYGAGIRTTRLQLGPNAVGPVLTDEDAGAPGGSSFGQVILQHFGVDGNGKDNPGGTDGIFTTAYYSTFENLEIMNCNGNGLHMGSSGLSNKASQNRVAGCRIHDCRQAGVLQDVNSVDNTITENFIHDCAYGVILRNGGTRVTNNDLYNHTMAAIQVKQTTYVCLIATNDLNGNHRHGIHITRASNPDGRAWGQMLVYGNSILGNDLVADNQFDGIYVTTEVPKGLAKLTLNGNKIFTLGGGNRFRYGIHLEANVIQTRCTGNDIWDAASGSYHIGESCSEITVDRMGGIALRQPEIPLSGIALINPSPSPATVYLSGGAVQSVALNGSPTGHTSGPFRLMPGGSITLVYTQPPGWFWFAD